MFSATQDFCDVFPASWNHKSVSFHLKIILIILTFLQAQQQSEIEAMLERDVRDDDSGLGIGIRHYPNKGRGIEAQKHFKKGDFIVEYAGDLMDLSEAKQRENEYAANAAMGCYMYYFKHSDKQYCIDATAESGRLGRLLNHSMRNPNCQTKVVMVRDTPRLILIAKTDIEPGTGIWSLKHSCFFHWLLVRDR